MPGGKADSSQSWTSATGPAAQFRVLTRRLAALTASALLALWQRLQDGQLTADDLALLGATAVQTANARAYGLADLYLAHQLAKPVLGLAAPVEQERLVKAVSTAASDTGTNPVDALDRLGRSEPLRSSQTAMTEGMKAHRVRGWTRATGGSPCVVCAGLADGTVLSPSTPMYSHAGCSCVPEPVDG